MLLNACISYLVSYTYLRIVSNNLPSVLVSYAYLYGPYPMPTYSLAYLVSYIYLYSLLNLPSLLCLYLVFGLPSRLPGLLCMPT